MAQIDPTNGQIVQTPTTVTPPIPTVVNTTVPPPTAATVYSAPNIQAAITAPTTAPNLSDPYGLYDQFYKTPDILAAEKAVAQGQQQINQVNQALRGTTRALENQNVAALGGTGASVNLIGRQVGRARQLTADELAALGETQAANVANLSTLRETAGQRYQIAQQERAQLQDLIRQTGGKAGISFADSFETALKKADNYQKEEEKRIKKEAYKESLKQTALQLGIKTKGSTKDIEKRLKKYYKSEKEFEATKRELELAASRKSLAGVGSGTAGERLGAAGASAQEVLMSSRGEDGKVDPGVYTAQRSAYMRAGGTSTEFDNQFAGLLSSGEQRNLGITAGAAKPLSAEANKQKQTALSGLKALDLIEQQATRGNLIQEALPGALGAREFRVNLREAMDAISRLRTGAALTANEEKFYRSQLPQAVDSQATIQRKVQNLREFFQGIANKDESDETTMSDEEAYNLYLKS